MPQLLNHEAFIHVATGLNGRTQTDIPILAIGHPGTTSELPPSYARHSGPVVPTPSGCCSPANSTCSTDPGWILSHLTLMTFMADIDLSAVTDAISDVLEHCPRVEVQIPDASGGRADAVSLSGRRAGACCCAVRSWSSCP